MLYLGTTAQEPTHSGIQRVQEQRNVKHVATVLFIIYVQNSQKISMRKDGFIQINFQH